MVSRLDAMKRDKIPVRMPPNPAPHISERLMEIGLVEGGGMAPSPISWREIGEWQRLTGVSIEPWEAKLIRRLSSEYIAEGRRAENEACPPPWRAPITQRERDVDEARLRMVLG